MSNSSPFKLCILPRQSMTWERFVAITPCNSIALDGMVQDIPRYDAATKHFNFDHHHGVTREATMSTAMQVYYALKGGLIDALRVNGEVQAQIYINDTDQDTAMAVWLLINHSMFRGTASIPHVNRLLALNDRWDITGGSFPMALDDKIVRQHNWVFRPYTDLRRTGDLAIANESVMRSNIEAVLGRLDAYLMGRAQEAELDTRHEILYDSPEFKIIDEIGGNEARYYLFSQGLKAYISLVARRPDGRFVYTVGRLSQYIPFPVQKLYADFNEAEGLGPDNGWNGSTIVGGSPRVLGSGLSWQQLRDLIRERLEKEKK